MVEFITLATTPIDRTAQAFVWLSSVPLPPNHVVGPLGGGPIRHKFVKDYKAPLLFSGAGALQRYMRTVRSCLYFLEHPPFADVFHNVGFDSLESGFPIHGEMSWMMQRKEEGGRAAKRNTRVASVGREQTTARRFRGFIVMTKGRKSDKRERTWYCRGSPRSDHRLFGQMGKPPSAVSLLFLPWSLTKAPIPQFNFESPASTLFHRDLRRFRSMSSSSISFHTNGGLVPASGDLTSSRAPGRFYPGLPSKFSRLACRGHQPT